MPRCRQVSGEQGAAPWAGEGRKGSTRVIGQEGEPLVSGGMGHSWSTPLCREAWVMDTADTCSPLLPF